MFPISIITVCFNEYSFIERTIQSVISQSLQNFEWIVIDGGSTDGTLEILNKYRSSIQVLVSEKDNGIYNAMNKGINLAKGDYLFFLNGGDYLFDNQTLEKIVSHNFFGDIVYGDIMIFDDQMKSYLLKMPEKLTTEFLYHKTIPHQSTFIKKELFYTIGKYDESYMIVADFEFLIKAKAHFNCNFQYVNLPFAWYLPGGISQNSEKRMDEKRKVYKKHFNFAERVLYQYRLLSKYYIFRNRIGNLFHTRIIL